MDLETIHCEWLVHTVRTTQNTYELVRHLRRGGTFTDELRTLIVDILEDRIKPRPRVKKPTIKSVLTYRDDNGRLRPNILLRGTLTFLQEMLKSPTEEDLQWMRLVLKDQGGVGPMDTKGQRTKLAQKLIAARYGLTLSQLNEILSQRTARVKSR